MSKIAPDLPTQKRKENNSLASPIFERRKRQFFLLALLVGIPSISFVWTFQAGENEFIRYGYLLLILVAILGLIGLLWKRIPITWVEYLIQTSIVLFFSAKYLYFLYFSPNLAAEWQEIEATFWVISMMYIIGYLIADHHFALKLSIAYSLLTTLLGVVRLWQDSFLLVELVRLQTRVMVISLLTFILAKVKDDLAISQREKAAMEEMAHTDELTRLPNRRSFTEMLEKRLQHPRIFALLLIDIDHFKRINDEYGHQNGDMVLARVGHALRLRQRPGDAVARWGGEEFVLLLEESDAQNARQVAERLRKAIEVLNPSNIPITISIGGTLCARGDTVESIFQRADRMLYLAKANGRNCVAWSE